MTNYRKQRAERKRLRMSAMGKASQRVQSKSHGWTWFLTQLRKHLS